MNLIFQKTLLFVALIFVTSWLNICLDETETVTLHLAGDSTLSIKGAGARPETGWGEPLNKFFKPSVNVINYAQNGRSTKTFISEGWWAKLVNQLEKGDYVVIQFGHNDAKKNTSRTTNPVDYRKNIEHFIKDVQNAGAIPILLTPIVRWNFDEDSLLKPTLGEYPDIVRDIAKKTQVDFVDMHAKSWSLLENTGASASRNYYMFLEAGIYPNFPEGKNDNTHTNETGAIAIAKLFVEGVKEIDCGLKKFLLD